MAAKLLELQFSASDMETIVRKLDELFPEAADAGVENVNQHMLDVERMNAPLPYSGQPFLWSSERQRRAFFATNGFGGGIPYRRTNDLFNGWILEGDGQNQVLINPIPYAKWVRSKDFQIIGMKDRKWTTLEDDVEKRKSAIGRWFNDGVRYAIEQMGLA